MRTRVPSLLTIAALACACATNPATGRRELSLVSEKQEIELGRGAAEEVRGTIGLYEDDSLAAYVNAAGQRLAAVAERPKLQWTFAVADDASVNAFALPGGYVYLTRGLLAHLDSEAEMAAVLGHEIAHVTARHSVSQISKAQLASFGLGLGMILKPELRNYGQLGQAGLSLLMLKYGRDDENEADELGLRYMSRAGYPTDAMPEVLQMLGRVSGNEKGGRVPTWLSTHPNPDSRLARVRKEIDEGSLASGARGERRETYLRRLDGLVYGSDPREGFTRGRRFHHPAMAFQIDFPDGFEISNTKQAVGAISARRDAIVVLTLSGRSSADSAAREFFAQSGIQEGRESRASLRGADALVREFAATSGDLTVRGLAAFVEHDRHVFQILAYTPSALWASYDGALEGSLESFRRLTDRRLLAVEPMRVRLVAAPRSMTLAELAGREGVSISPRELALLNGVDEDEPLRSGRLVKIVVGDELAQEIVREQARQRERERDSR
jgi:predicted Zn-dependent protease